MSPWNYLMTCIAFVLLCIGNATGDVVFSKAAWPVLGVLTGWNLFPTLQRIFSKVKQ